MVIMQHQHAQDITTLGYLLTQGYLEGVTFALGARRWDE